MSLHILIYWLRTLGFKDLINGGQHGSRLLTFCSNLKPLSLESCIIQCRIIQCRLHDDVIRWKTFSALLGICAGNSPVTGKFPAQRPVTRSFDVFSDLCLNKRLSKQSWGWWFETLSHPLWRHCNVYRRILSIYSYISGLFHWHSDNHVSVWLTTTPQVWRSEGLSAFDNYLIDSFLHWSG